MNPGSIFFDEEFAFHDGETGEKLFVVLGTINSISIVVKTTSKQHGRGIEFGCQPKDRFHNFFLPPGCCYLKTQTWVCLNEFYEINASIALQKRFSGKIKPVCTLEDSLIRAIQDCAALSADISSFQASAIKACLV
ncbi:hypothetical protein [Methylocystis parvus]|uniref:hypothetical protein n=1 Tax=Methylocystis parvus TaxID=134 RepID=UPI003C773B88